MTFAPDPADLACCREAIRTGSRSFHVASRLLPARVRDPALALYAFCRQADDAVDLQPGKAAAVEALRRRLDRIYAGNPADAPADRAFAEAVRAFDMPAALPEALLEGFEWDAAGRRCADMSDLRAYAARVAGSVGAMMTVLMGVRDRDILARACDLGCAMQLTNIARDVAEDGAAGRLYLPLDLLAEAGVDPDAPLGRPTRVFAVVRLVLKEADALYARADAGIARLPPDCRAGIHAARLIYSDIGTQILRAGPEGLAVRARTRGRRKAALAALAVLRAGGDALSPTSARLHAAPLTETRGLVAAAGSSPGPGDAASTFISILSTLELRDRNRRRSSSTAAAT